MSVPMVQEHTDTVTLFDPSTGEVLDLAGAPVETLAHVRSLISDEEGKQRVAKQQLDAELHRRMDFEATLKLHVEGWTITGKPDTVAEWDTGMLERALTVLVEDGELSEEAARRALKPVVTLKPMAGELKKLAARFPVVAECRVQVPQSRRATVKRAAS